jgi:carboxyl-terminal processing protease
VDVYTQIEPIGNVLDEILKHYVHEPDIDEVVEGALVGIMNSLDDHSSYVPPMAYRDITDETQGQFDGIGVSIQLNEDKNIVVFMPIEGAPAHKAGIQERDIIIEIDGESTKGLGLEGAAERIKGPRGTIVHLKVFRPAETEGGKPEVLEFDIKRGKIPLESIVEARVLDEGIGYVRISDFKRTTAGELAKRLKELNGQGLKSLIIDMRWNPGGLLNSAVEVSDLFLGPNTLVTYTQGRAQKDGSVGENMTLYTKNKALYPENLPIILLVNRSTASSSEIVTGALQFWTRAIVVGEKTFGKGSVQTIIPLRRPEGSALRLTTALYYTPAEVTIHKQGILPDVESPMTIEDQGKLRRQMYESYKSDPSKMRAGQNHGGATGDEIGEKGVEDTQLLRAIEILKEDAVFENLLKKHHKDTKETQVAAA